MSSIFSTRLASFWSQARTLRRECRASFKGPTSLPPPCLASSFLSSFVLSTSLPASSPASLRPPCLAFTLLLFHLTVHLPSPLSILAIRVELQSKQLVRDFIWAKSKMPTRLVHSVSTTASKKLIWRITRETIFTRSMYRTVEIIQMFHKIVYGRRRSLSTLVKFQLVWPQPCQILFSNSHKPKGASDSRAE